MRTCQEFAELYELYAMGALDPEDRSEFEEHLAMGCSVCAGGVKHAGAFVTLLGATMPEQIQAPPRLRQRILASIGVQKTNLGWIGALATATVALTIAVVWSNAENRERQNELVEARAQIRRTAADLASAQSALQFLNEPETKQVLFGQGQQAARGRVFVNVRRGVLLIVSNLPPAPSGKIYELWVIPKRGAPQPSGLFQSDAQGDAMYFRGGAVDMSTTGAIAVTLEQASGSNAPTTTPRIVAPVAGL